MSALSAGVNPGPASSMLKTQGTEAMQRIDELAIEIDAHYGAVDQPAAREAASNQAVIGPDHSLVAMARYLNNRAGSIYGGSNEIQRNIMARLVLGFSSKRRSSGWLRNPTAGRPDLRCRSWCAAPRESGTSRS